MVICTNTMKLTWAEEWARWCPDATVAVVDGTPARKRKALESGADVTIINWEGLRSHSRLQRIPGHAWPEKERQPGLLNREWATVIADEAHRAKDPRAKQTRALWAIAEQAQHRFALTGTPLANSPEDLWSVMHFVAPDDWPDKRAFVDRYCFTAYNPWSGGSDAIGLNPATRDELFRILDPRFLRRTKAEVLPDLPPKTFSTRLVEMGKEQERAYAAMRDEMLALLDSGVLMAGNPMTRTLRLVQMASACLELDLEGNVASLVDPSCKVDALLDLVGEMGGSPLVVFAVSRKLVELASRRLEKAKVPHVLVTGQVKAADRTEAVARFQDGVVPVLLATTGAGGEGLTLTAASTTCFLQRSWSLIENLQAEDRTHRIGQEAEAVQIIDLVTARSVEAAVHAAFRGKENLLQEVVRDPAALRRLLSDG